MAEQGLFQDIADYIRLSKDSVDLVKNAWSLLPKGSNKDEAERKLQAAEDAHKRTDAALALKLGYKLCQCDYPPQIMLFDKASGDDVCRSCGYRISRIPSIA